jgi:hypothetical protein
MLGAIFRTILVNLVPGLCHYGFKYLIDHTHPAGTISEVAKVLRDSNIEEKVLETINSELGKK